MGKPAKKYEELTIIDDFMFGKVMSHPKRCRKLLEIILGVKIRKIVFIDNQESLNPDYRAKGIRLDIYVEDAKSTIYNVEMQTTSPDNLPKRSRYYQSVIDISLTEKGTDYHTLKKSYVIFICTFDPFGRGRHIYHFENLCREDTSVHLADETEKIFLNTKGTMDDVDENLQNLLRYFESFVPQDSFTKELDDAVMYAKEHRKWRHEYMKLTLWEMDIKREAEKEGRAAGLAEGEVRILVSLVCRKMAKGKSPKVIAEELEMDLPRIARIYDAAIPYAPDFDTEKILQELL